MADWLNIAGGAAKGYNEGVEDDRRRQEFNSLQRQRQRVEKQQKLDDDLSATLKGIRPPGSYEDATPANTTEAAPGFTGPPSGTKKVTVTPADYTQAQAAALARDGRLSNVVASHQLRQTALQTQAAEAAAKRAEAQDTLMQAAQLKARGDVVGAARILQQGYSKHPDGHDIVIEDRGGVPHIAVAGPDGRFLQPPTPITDQSVQAMIDKGITMLTPETYMQGRKLDIEGRMAGAAERQAGAHETTADAARMKAVYETGPEARAKDEAYTKHLADTGNAALITARAHQAMQANNKRQTKTEQMNELVAAYTPIIMQANPGMSEAAARQHAAQVAIHDPNVKEAPVAIAGTEMVYDPSTKTILKPNKDGTGFEPVYKPGDIKQLGTTVAANLPPKTGAAGAPATPAAASEPDPDGSKAAAQKVAEAERALSRYGLRQQKQDPAGYAAAVKQRAAARAELDTLNTKYAGTQPTGTAFTYRP